MYIGPIKRQTLSYATLISCGNNRQNWRALDRYNIEHHVLTPKAVFWADPTLFEPKQVHPAVSSNTLTIQEAGIYFKAELPKLWKSVSFTNFSDTTLKFSGKALSFDFSATSEKYTSAFFSNPNKHWFNFHNLQG